MPPENRQIERYRLVRELGRGGMGCVSEVLAEDGVTHLALKAFALDHGNRAFLEKRFLAEAKILARLNHPRLVHVREFGVDASTGRPYYVMNLVLNAEGKPETLEDVGVRRELCGAACAVRGRLVREGCQRHAGDIQHEALLRRSP